MLENTTTPSVAPRPRKERLFTAILALNTCAVLALGAHTVYAAHKADKGSAPAPVAATPARVTFALEPLVANLKAADAERYVKLAMHVEVAGEAERARVEASELAIRDRVITLLAATPVEATTEAEGRAALQRSLREAMNQVMGRTSVLNLYFSEFIVQ